MKLFFQFILVALPLTTLVAQEDLTKAEKEAAYTKTITTRADKIVSGLQITDVNKSTKVRDLIAGQYRALNVIYTYRDEQIKKAKDKDGDKEALVKEVKVIEDAATAKTEILHKSYLLNLSSLLTPEQVTITYNGYLDMLPQLTPDQKTQIMNWLVEAREHAMDAESSEKKHWWFGKYKGRINNYLSAAGYDMKKEGEAWQKRIKAKESETKN
jgi:Spy/CpxP family protein refolding chaperone